MVRSLPSNFGLGAAHALLENPNAARRHKVTVLFRLGLIFKNVDEQVAALVQKTKSPL